MGTVSLQAGGSHSSVTISHIIAGDQRVCDAISRDDEALRRLYANSTTYAHSDIRTDVSNNSTTASTDGRGLGNLEGLMDHQGNSSNMAPMHESQTESHAADAEASARVRISFRHRRDRWCCFRWYIGLFSGSFLADISVRSPRKLFIFIIKNCIYRIKVSKKKCFNFEKNFTA